MPVDPGELIELGAVVFEGLHQLAVVIARRHQFVVGAMGDDDDPRITGTKLYGVDKKGDIELARLATSHGLIGFNP